MTVLFVGGCDRSGTTLAASMLGHALQAVVLPESQFLVDHLLDQTGGGWDGHAFAQRLVSHPRFLLWGIRPTDSQLDAIKESASPEAAISILASMVARGDVATGLVVDQTPWSLSHHELLRGAVPSAKFVHVVRDGRAVYASMRRLPWGPNHAYHAALFWQMRVAQGLFAERSADSPAARLSYEDLLAHPSQAIRDTCARLGLPIRTPTPGLAYVSLGGTGLYQPRLSAPDPSRAEAWRSELSSSDVSTFEYWAGPTLARLGYELSYSGFARPPGPWRRLRDGFSEFARYYILNPPQHVWRLRRAQRQSGSPRRRGLRQASPDIMLYSPVQSAVHAHLIDAIAWYSAKAGLNVVVTRQGLTGLIDLLRHRRALVYLAAAGLPSPLFWMLSRVRRNRVIYYLHEPSSLRTKLAHNDLLKSCVWQAVQRLDTSRADVVLVSNATLESRVSEVTKRKRGRVALAPLLYKPAASPAQPRDRITYVGRVDERRYFREFLALSASFTSQGLRPTLLVNSAPDAKIPDHVEVLATRPFSEELKHEVLSQTAVIWNPKRVGISQSGVTAEALRFGCRVVLTEHDPELPVVQELGLWVDLADARGGELRQVLERPIREDLSQRFSEEHGQLAFERCYLPILRSRRTA